MADKVEPIGALRDLRAALSGIRGRHPHLTGPPGPDDVAAWEQTLTEAEAAMTAKEPITLRLAPDMLARLDRLAERLASDPAAAALGRANRQAAARLALVRGLDVLEAEAAGLTSAFPEGRRAPPGRRPVGEPLPSPPLKEGRRPRQQPGAAPPAGETGDDET